MEENRIYFVEDEPQFGEAQIRVVGVGGAGGNAILNGLEINGEYVPPYVPTGTQRLDFGTTTSPVEAGFTQVSDQSHYNNQIGYGWVSYTGLPFGKDRGTGTATSRDFVYQTFLVFRVDVPNGTYRVEATFADPAGTHEMNLYLQGTLREAVVAPAGEVVVKAYTVTVTDGHILLKLNGKEVGIDDNAIINALRIDPIV